MLAATKEKIILIVDDDSRNIFALSALLINKGYTCVSALNGMQCMEVLEKRHNVEVIMMDIMMPFMNGIETIKLIRSKKEYAKIRIFVLTADDSFQTRQNSMAAGADAFFNKPIDADKLLKIFVL
jgi:two-component system cell cycle response regulator DivK